MPLNLGSSKKQRSFNMPVSFRVNERNERLRDALNVISNQERLETRFGRSLYNSTLLSGQPLSVSFFKTAGGTRYLIAKVGTTIYSVASSGAHTAIKTGLSATTKHRGITWARGASSRHIISCESDGLFQWDGTNFTQLGQAGPSAPTVAAGTGSLTNGTYKVYLTYYSSTTGFESNAGAGSSNVTTAAQGVDITNIPSTASNATIDKIRIYLDDVGDVDDPIYVAEISLGTTTYSITSDPTSTSTHPTANAAPSSGGGKFLTEFNRKLVYAGNSTYKNDVYFSEQDLPDGFNDGNAANRLVLYAPLDGEITGIATGLYNNSVLDPYLVVFKKRSTHIYSEINGEGKFVPISAQIGCVSHDSISVKNGDIFFLSDNGWRAISNGRLINNESGNAATLGDGDIDDIFRQPGFIYEVNRSQLSNAFSVYYSTLDQYMTWVPEGSGTDLSKTYCYEFMTGGFKPFQFYSPSTCACIGEDSSGDEVVFMGDTNGAFYTHSSKEDRSDDDYTGSAKSIESFGMLTWMNGDDLDCSYNFRNLNLERVYSDSEINIKTWINYSFNKLQEYSPAFSDPEDGAFWDEAEWDEAIWGDERAIVPGYLDINRCGLNLLVGFYMNEIDGNLNLVSAQLDFSKNGNKNI
jgi:hypothetical protein